MKDFLYKKLIIYFVLFSPIIDIITSYMYYHDMHITIGLLIKGVVLILAIVYLIFLDKEKRKRNLLFLLIVGFCLIINIYNSIDVIKIAFFSYFTYLFKYLYYIIMLLFFIRWYKEYNIKLSDLRIPIIIISISTILSIITKTAYISYQQNIYKMGFSMWYSSANELGNILCLLFPVSIYNGLHNKDGIRLDLYLIPIVGATMLLLGTKVGLFGYFLIILFYLIIRIILCKTIKLDRRFLIMLILLLVPLTFGKNIPGVYNMVVSKEQEADVLNGRRAFLEKILKERSKTGVLSKVFGQSYYGEIKKVNQIMIVEMDFIDVFFMYGYVGIIIVLLPLIYLYRRFLLVYLKMYKENKKISKKYLTVFVAISLCFITSFISGHAILSPSVSLYLVLLIALLTNLKFNITQRRKPLILVGNSEDKLPSKYDKEIVEKNFKNRFIAYLAVRNQKYDYVLMSDNDSSYIKTYLKYSNGEHIDSKKLK